MVGEDHILYANPFWTKGNLRHACENNVGMLMFENENELQRISVSYPDARLMFKTVEKNFLWRKNNLIFFRSWRNQSTL